jgi:alditol oxidase
MLLPLVEKELAPFDPRAHWGKPFTISPATLRSRCKKLPDFIQLSANHDPQGKFRYELFIGGSQA